MRKYLLGIPALLIAGLIAAVLVTAGNHPGSGSIAIPASASASTPAAEMPANELAYRHPVTDVPVLAWHQVIAGVADSTATDIIWNFNKDCKPTAAVCDAPGNPETVSLAQFTAELAALKRAGYQSITASQYLSWTEGKNPALPAKPILLTFDDGTVNSYYGVTQVLERYGYNAVTFIVSQFANGATAGQQPYVGWDMTWDQLRALPASVWSFAFHAGAHGHNITFPQNTECEYYYPCQLPSETAAQYEARVSGEITQGRADEESELGTRIDANLWAVPWNDLAQQANLPREGAAQAWLAGWAATQFQLIFIQDPARNGVEHERYRLEVQGTWSLSEFKSQLNNNISDGFFTRA